MLSPLARGYGSWDGAHFDPYNEKIDEEKLPSINEPETHRHGVTVGHAHLSRCSTSFSMKSSFAPSVTPRERCDRFHHQARHHQEEKDVTYFHVQNEGSNIKIDLPKTFLTKKGALVLFTAPQDEEDEEFTLGDVRTDSRGNRTNRGKNLIDATLRLGTLDKLALSVLQYGNEESTEKENTEVQDEKQKLFIKFLHKAEKERQDLRAQPGSDLNSYLRDLRYNSRGSVSDTYIPRSREVQELRAILQGLQDDKWPIIYNPEGGTEIRSGLSEQFTRPASQQSSRAKTSLSGASTPRSILSATKLRASIKSYNSYLGRPATEQDNEGSGSPITRIGIRRRSGQNLLSDSDDILLSSMRQRRAHTTKAKGSIVEEDDMFDLLTFDNMAGIDGSSVAFTESTDLDKHMYAFDLPSGGSYVNNINGPGNGEGKKSGDGVELEVVQGQISETESEVEMLYVAGNGSTPEASSSNNIDLVVAGQKTNKRDHSAQYNYESDGIKHFGDGIDDNVKITDSISANSIVDISSAVSSQRDPFSEIDKFDGETSTTVSEELVDPSGINKVDIKTILTGTIHEENGDELPSEGEIKNDDALLNDESQGDWEQTAEDAAHTEVDLAKFGVVSEDIDGDEVDEGYKSTAITEEKSLSQNTPDNAQNVSPASHGSPVRSNASPQRASIVNTPQRKESVLSLKRTSLTPGSRKNSLKSPTPPSPGVRKTPSPMLRRASSPAVKKMLSPTKPTTPEASEVPIKRPSQERLPSPEIRGKNTPPAVIITKKQDKPKVDKPQDLPSKDTHAKTEPVLSSQNDSKIPEIASKPEQNILVSKDSAKGYHDDNVIPPSVDAKEEFEPTTSDKTSASTPEESVPNIEVAPAHTAPISHDQGEVAQTVDEKVVTEDVIVHSKEEEDDTFETSTRTSDDEGAKERKPKDGFDIEEGIEPKMQLDQVSDMAHGPLVYVITGAVSQENQPEIIPKDTSPKKDELPTIPDFLKPKPQKQQPKREKKARKPKAKKDVTKAISVASIQPEEDKSEGKQTTHKQFVHQKVVIPKEKEVLVIPDHMKEAFERKDEESKEALEQQMKEMANIIDDTLKPTSLNEEYLEEGLTEEELLIAKQEVEEKLNIAKERIEEAEKPPTSPRKMKDDKQDAKPKGKKKAGKDTKPQPSGKEIIKAQKELQKQKKLEEKRKLEEQIKEKEDSVKNQEKASRDRELEIQLEMERLKQEEQEMQLAVDEVHKYLAESRQKQREERESRRKADQERRRELAKEKYEQERKKREEESRKAMEELERIHDLEMRKQKRLEEEMRREEEERVAQEREEEEEKERVKAAEEQEKRMREIESQMEEEEMQRLYREEQEIARQRILLEMERQKIQEEEELKRQALLEDQLKLEAIKRKQEEEEQKIINEQKRRLQELKEMEEAARLKMQKELEERRANALARREQNLESRANMDKLKQSQGLTRAWVFSYFVKWPLESYNIPFGGDETKKKGFRPKATRPKTAM